MDLSFFIAALEQLEDNLKQIRFDERTKQFTFEPEFNEADAWLNLFKNDI